ncbi:MAG: hypothetical protein H0T89_15625 [Deltaproteobacteria bacterium]|nr:hypothetical protein [Deltaproteobacteria bacterium]MDQ3300008.1 hypothetical protein [Myxococcota bacterium]
MYAIYFDNGGGSAYNYSVKANSQMLTPAAEAEPNNTIGNAPIASALPFLVTGATLSSVTDADWVGIDVTPEDFGKRLRVLTAGPDPYTDTVVEIFKSNGTTTFGGPSRDSGFAENHTSPVLAEAGRYYVKVTASQDYFMDTNNQYVVALWLE